MPDEFVCDTPEVRSFIAKVKEIAAGTASVEARLAAIRPPFSRMMADPDWLPGEFRRTSEAGGMGQGIANWLLYRPSISLHLPGNDVGCVWRHRSEPETGEVAPFRTGCTNKDCEAESGNI